MVRTESSGKQGRPKRREAVDDVHETHGNPQKTDREDTKTFSGGTEIAGNLSGRDRIKCSRGRTKEKETQRKPMRNMGNPQETAGSHEKPSGNA